MSVTPMLQISEEGRYTRQAIAYQFGGYLLPRVQFTSEISWKYRSTTDDHAFMADGAVDTAAALKRAPIDLGTMRYSGKYVPMRQRRRFVAGFAQSEIAGIFALGGTWQQLVIHVRDNVNDDCESCSHILKDNEDGVWLWTWAKIEEPTIKSDTDGIMKGVEATEFNFILREPFREVDSFAWRFGEQPPVRQARTMKEMEQLVFSGNARRPTRMPECGETNRWYWRDPLACINTSCICFYDAECLWGTDNYLLTGNTKVAINVPGTFEATGYLRAEENGTIIRVINDVHFVQEVTLDAGETIDLDYQTVYTKCTPKVTSISRFPRITPGINRFEVVGRALIGIRPRWIF